MVGVGIFFGAATGSSSKSTSKEEVSHVSHEQLGRGRERRKGKLIVHW